MLYSYGAVTTGRGDVLKILQRILSVAVCPVWKVQNCPKVELLTLYRMNNMPECVKHAVVILQGKDEKAKGAWQPAKEAVTLQCSLFGLQRSLQRI